MIDVNKPVTNPKLFEAINKMREVNTKQSQDEVIKEVVNAHLIAPISISPTPQESDSSGTTVLKKDTTINFNIIENTNNEKFILTFTDWNELKKWNNAKDQQTLIVTFTDLRSMILDDKGNLDGFAINPFTQNLTFNKSMVSALYNEIERLKNGGVVEEVVKKNTQVQLGQPRNYPRNMIDEISLKLKKRDKVRAAYLQLMVKEGKQSYLIIIDSDGDSRELFNDIGKVAVEHSEGMLIDMVPYNSEFGKRAAANIEPFYRKKKRWLFGR